MQGLLIGGILFLDESLLLLCFLDLGLVHFEAELDIDILNFTSLLLLLFFDDNVVLHFDLSFLLQDFAFGALVLLSGLVLLHLNSVTIEFLLFSGFTLLLSNFKTVLTLDLVDLLLDLHLV